MFLVSVFSATALALAAVGIYGVLAYSVAQRRQELGIRMALGAEKSHIVALVVRQGFMLVGIGIAIGIVFALAGTRSMSTMLYKVKAYDLTTFLLAPIVFATIGLLASYLPAKRATQVDPTEALRGSK